MGSPKLNRNPPLAGADREALCRALAAEYEAGDTIRSIAARHGRSYGGVRRLLVEARVVFRPRGGAGPR